MNTTYPALRLVRALVLFAFVAGLALAPVRPAYAATLTVNSLADTNDGACTEGNCTLREAINQANSQTQADTIYFNVSGTIALGSQLPNIQSAKGELTIDGADNIVISGNDTNRAFTINSLAYLTLRNLEIKKGYAGGDSHGGAIYNSGILTIQDCYLDHNRAYNKGGGIYNSGNITLVDTDFTANTTDVGSGGGIYNASGKTLNLTGGNFYSNYADFAGGGIYNQGYLTLLGTMFFYNHAFNNDGGAIYSEKYADIEQATFSLNEAELDGGAFSNDGGDFVIKSSTFMGNTAGSKGGGVHVPDTHLTAKIRQSTFSYNYARSGAGIYNDTGDIDIYNSVFSHNDATVNDGGGGYNLNGTINIYSSTFESNSADGNGGGFYNNGILRIYYNLFSGNSAGDDGGGVWSDSSSGVLIVQNSTYYDNDAARGGAFYAMESVLLTNITVSGNRATTTGGGGGLYATSETLLKNSIIANSTSGGNCASGGFYPANSGNNIDSGTTCGFGSANGSLSSTNPQLEALKDNGGATKTMALLPGSPAVNHVIWSAPNNCPDDDQREYPRPYGTYCDIGAFERYYRTFLPLAIK